ncbi:hypothetical protein BDA96_01G141800 [Sorghum bicolor]|uniref:Uncharacterized protein n=2 Tax=Sorghum bicolor TaxID=4558 RepID=A0A921RY24_SORBI|nr:hypothetical protein BDA96_01G141800 [Sorghum bicolor]OQU91196.1 hypothetical protein SORBI_3001G135950 [Sorghum bicolor]
MEKQKKCSVVTENMPEAHLDYEEVRSIRRSSLSMVFSKPSLTSPLT